MENGDVLPTKYRATYLGNEISREANIKLEILVKTQEVRRFEDTTLLESIQTKSGLETHHV